MGHVDWQWAVALFLAASLLIGAGLAVAALWLRPRWERDSARRAEQDTREELEGPMAELQRQLSVRSAELDQWRGRAEALDAELARRKEELGTYRVANVQFDRGYQQLKRRNEQLEQELTTVSGQFQGLKRHMLCIRRHTVFLDGCTKSGKSTFIQRIINPLVGEQELLLLTATPHPILSPPIPLGVEATERGMLLHVVRFYDIAGENAAGLNDVLMEYYDQRRAGSEIGGETLGQAAGLVVWNTSAGTEINIEHLSPARAQTVYYSRRVQEVLERIVVFMNQCDRLQQDHPGDSEKVELLVNEQVSVIRDRVFAKIPDGFKSKLQFIQGSALYGTGVQNCFGELLRALGLTHLFAESPPNGEAGLPADMFQTGEFITGAPGAMRRRVSLGRESGT